ncbi:MAG: glycogen/starch synthase [Alistipes sp.]|nr:glycogen synthase [Rikenellaceae bacterium]MBQ3148097.1 glycogen/starch synthase [Alistipes sp.]MBQ4127531.1 glycogen/starch synthase [Alistipes sp.]
MASRKILYVCQEIMPYLPESELSSLSRHLVQAMQERGNEIRTFMPRYGCINERRNQLHEVIRLSGMNLIIDDNDHQLIIKVASIPSARIQIYFIDNDDFFSRKATLTDAEGNEFADNDERAIFFARGVLETVRKLNWTPTVVHCMGWMSAITPIYLKKVFHDDPLFRDVKVVVTLCNDRFEQNMSQDLDQKIANEGVKDENLANLSAASYENLYRFVIDYADGIVVASEQADASLVEYARQSGKPMLEYQQPDAEKFFDNYNEFYDKL